MRPTKAMTAKYRIEIPDSELSWRFSRSSGPGGQHVNTTDTRVEVTWSLTATDALTQDQKDRAAVRLRGRLSGDESITVASSAYRSQHRNREAAKDRLEELVNAAIVPPKARRATRPSRRSIERNRSAKRHRGEIKKLRRPPA